jgi:CheY-like chemotaxis protein
MNRSEQKNEATNQTSSESNERKSGDLRIAWIEALPRLLLILLLAVFVATYSDEIKMFLTRTTELSFAGVSIKADFADLKEQFESGPNPQELDAVGSRVAILWARSARGYYQGAHLLWVDDHPENNIPLRRVIKRYGAEVVIATSSDEAMNMVKRDEFDLIISDIKRDDRKDIDGIQFLSKVRELTDTPVIFYIFNKSDEPIGGAFAIENVPDRLLFAVSDALMTYRKLPQR